MLSIDEVTEHIIPAFSIFTNEKAELQIMFLEKLPEVIEYVYSIDQEKCSQAVILYVQPQV